MRHLMLGAFAAILTISVTACNDETAKTHPKASAAPVRPTADTLRIAAAVTPVSWLVCQVAGDPCAATTLVPPGASAHAFEPKPSLLTQLSTTRLYFSSGLSFEEAWVPRFKSGLPSMEVIVLKPVQALPSQEKGHEHSEPYDPHVWSSPRAMIPWIDSIALALATAYPADTARIWKNRDLVRARMLRLDTAVRQELAPFSGKRFYITHPELGYLARDYGLEQKPLEEGGREPSLPFLFEAKETAKRQGIRAVFVEEAYGTRTAQALARALDVPVIPLDLYASPYDSAIMRLARTLSGRL